MICFDGYHLTIIVVMAIRVYVCICLGPIFFFRNLKRNEITLPVGKLEDNSNKNNELVLFLIFF